MSTPHSDALLAAIVNDHDFDLINDFDPRAYNALARAQQRDPSAVHFVMPNGVPDIVKLSKAIENHTLGKVPYIGILSLLAIRDWIDAHQDELQKQSARSKTIGFRSHLPYCDRKVIRQIIPATNVVAVYEMPDGSHESYPVVCWALVDIDDGYPEGSEDAELYQNVEGLIIVDGTTYLDFVDGDEGKSKFLTYDFD